MHINKNKQNGSSTYATMFILLVLIFAAVTLMKLWAPYFDDMAVKTALKNLSEEETTRSMAPNEIRNTLNKRLSVNGVKLEKEEVVIKKEDGEILINVIYERRIPMYGNVDAMLKFQHDVAVKAKG
ncbi:MAG: hypothetical protein CMK83_23315 [Pseudomonadales bacterium]|jgi:hypothetical protein|uniref:DUF4845 domain-containing protein n=1 Tax=unclassified Ketobacter TaxID=2639109 RepID=UPI000C478366|nr:MULTISPECIES: DUF4845 domain-containing protein [unclassified Ketobacter]MAA58814.1 hypothetical protein [Pseudomonadales bacterium]MEC8813661.1 DUF4845 domain-containing protein [Pseudomonadota bacterium]TNC89610.1 MAG: hypothetical protein CSH49_06640 [Alcanivorax sp.]HAU13801.1 hypothetical protein [Gammaproteobacteria bacterium]MAQ27150.1 hypothetical protein [Pseudomonadales bacterium]|tara:strand:- start:1493 stop:1870 length:378 start_codon:yes stop_codon:yes gene_type:complete